MPKRSREKKTKKNYHNNTNNLQQISCIETVLQFLSVADVCALRNCTKISPIHLKCFIYMSQQHRWNFDELSTTSKIDLNCIQKFTFQSNNQSAISCLQNLKNIKYLKTTFKLFHNNENVNIETLPNTILEWICDIDSIFTKLKSLPSNLLSFHRHCHFEVGMPRLTFADFPSSLTSLTFSTKRDLEYIVLPQCLVFLNICCQIKELKPGLIPQSVQTLVFGSYEMCEIQKNALPNNLIKLILICNDHLMLANDAILPPTLLKMDVGTCFNVFKLTCLPPNLKTLKYECSETFFSRFTNRVLPSSLQKLICFSINPFANSRFIPEDMMHQLKQIKHLEISHRKYDTKYFYHLDGENLKVLSLNIGDDSIMFQHLQGLRKLFLEYSSKAVICGLHLLTNLTDLRLGNNFLPLDSLILPVNLIALEMCKMQNVHYLTKLKKLSIFCQGPITLIRDHFPENLSFLEIEATTVNFHKRSINGDVFPLKLHTLFLSCNFQKRKLQFPESLHELTLSKCFADFNLKNILPKNLYTCNLPKICLNNFNNDVPKNVRFRY